MRQPPRLIPLLTLLAVSSMGAANVAAEELTVERDGANVRVLVDGELYAAYITDDGPKPYVWPLIGPTGVPMSRAYPMAEVEGEKQDHVHHRSLWFTHGDVDGVDYWSEGATNTRMPHGKIVHREFERVESDGKVAEIVAISDWIDADGERRLEDRRTLRFKAHGKRRLVDFDVVLTAIDEPVTFNDTKEGSFGVRVPTWMDVEGDKKKKTTNPGSLIVNSEGQTDVEAWGNPARWVDYQGVLNGERLGIAIMDHPSSFRHPTTWHVRTYGLFAANPFGLQSFDPAAAESGKLVLKPGESLHLRYLVLFHTGDEKEGGVEEAFEWFGKQ